MVEFFHKQGKTKGEIGQQKAEPDDALPQVDEASGDVLVDVLPTVEKIVQRKFSLRAEAADLVQSIALRLVRWRTRNRDKSESMTSQDWTSFAARTAFNEINRAHSELKLDHLSLDEVQDELAAPGIEGQTKSELKSLVSSVWPEICQLSLRQRRALLLHSSDLVIDLLDNNVTDRELAEKLEISYEKWLEIKWDIPLQDPQLAVIFTDAAKSQNMKSVIKSFTKARFEARAKIDKLN